MRKVTNEIADFLSAARWRNDIPNKRKCVTAFYRYPKRPMHSLIQHLDDDALYGEILLAITNPPAEFPPEPYRVFLWLVLENGYLLWGSYKNENFYDWKIVYELRRVLTEKIQVTVDKKDKKY